LAGAAFPRERLGVFEVADQELDRGVVAVIGVGDEHRGRAVGGERGVAPIGEQLGLRADQAGTADDQPPATSVVSAICASPVSG
jgi:hypothetical protein